MNKPEFFKDMDIDTYHSHNDILSKSMLTEFADCPARFKHHYIDNKPKRQTKSLRLGSAVHVLALEPDKWKSGYHVMPTTYFDDKGEEKPWRNDPRMKVYEDQMLSAGYDIDFGPDKKKIFVERSDSKIILTRPEFETVEKMAEALTRDPYALALLKSPGYVESSIFFDYLHTNDDGEPLIDEETGEQVVTRVRTRPDLNRNDTVQVDLKTARSVKPDLFFSDAFNMNYDLSAALGTEGFKALHGQDPDEYVFIAVESTEPYLISCFDSTKPMDALGGLSYLDYGRAHLRHLMNRLHECKKTGIWPGYQVGIKPMKIPQWAVRNFMERGFD